MPAGDLLSEMRTRHTAVAIVIDEFGGTSGMVTFAGLMERIVGEVGPDGADNRITTLADGSALIDGLALVADVNAQFGLHIDEEAYNTLGGYVLGRLGRRARVGDRFEVERRTLRVEALDGLRVARVFLSKEREDGRGAERLMGQNVTFRPSGGTSHGTEVTFRPTAASRPLRGPSRSSARRQASA